MTEPDILLPVAVLAILRGNETVRSVADRLGATEAEVERWKDIFTVAGTLALKELQGSRPRCEMAAADLAYEDVNVFFPSEPPTSRQPPQESGDPSCDSQPPTI